mgnify:CR=1 FL=1
MNQDPIVLYSDSDLLVINKPAGLLVHKSDYQKKEEKTLVDWLLKNFPAVKNVGDDPKFRPGIVHRLDRETSGIMLVALNQEYFSYLKKLFQEKKITKTYLAIVKGEMKDKKGRIEKPIGINPGTTKRSTHSSKMSKEAITNYELVKNFKLNDQDVALVRVFPLTGRTHQIRVHMASINHPVIGDNLYGGKTNAKLADHQMLHCFSLEFEKEPGRQIRFEAEPPDDFKKIASEVLTRLK